MSSVAVGERVGAILSADQDEVRLLGYGVYDGDHEPPFGPMQCSKEERDKAVKEMKDAGHLPADYTWKNPRITLDDGQVVWGAQCWWGAEELIKARIGNRRVVMVKVEGA